MNRVAVDRRLGTVGEIVDFENTFLLCYVRGPEEADAIIAG
jgi:hypothetical protein